MCGRREGHYLSNCRVLCHGFHILHCNLEANLQHQSARLIKYTIMAHKAGPKKGMHSKHMMA